MSDIVPELLASIQDDFSKELDKNKKISDLVKMVKEGTATYLEADEYALEVGEILAEAFKRNISADILPDGKLYYNIAKRILEPTLKDNYDLITEVTKSVQETINKNAGIGIKAIKPNLNQDKVDGLIDAVSSADEFDKAVTYLDEPVKNFSQSIVMDSVKVNAEFQHGAGLSPKIQRTSAGKCCKWCQGLVGSYSYPDVPKDVYRRHDYCRCKVDYVVGKEQKNVHNNNIGKRRYVQDEYGTYEKSKDERIRHAQQMKATEKERKEAARQKRIETWKNKKDLTQKEDAAKKFLRTFETLPKDKVVETMRFKSISWIKSLTKEEVRCIQKYTLNEIKEKPKFYERLNAMLRGDAPEEQKLRYYADVISDALKKSVLEENVVCYRGMNINVFENYGVGDLFTNEQFTSTSVKRSGAFDKPVQMIIYAPKGTKGVAYIEQISKFPKQREMLFDKDCIYEVLSNKENLIEVRVI